jgi:hypothetical protein
MIPELSRLSATLAAAALLGSSACQDATAPAQQPPVTLSAPLVSVELIAALADVDLRAVPALDPAARPPMHAALHALRNALLTGDHVAAQRALATTRALGDTARSTGGDDADLSAITLVVDVTAQTLGLP